MPRQIILADDHAIVRQGLKQILMDTPDIVVAGEASRGEEVLDQLAAHPVDVVLLVVTPATPSSRSVREHLRIASLYQRQLVFVWAAGEEIAAVLPDEWGRAAEADLVDARNERYERALGEIVACLEEIPGEERSLAEPAEGE